MHYSIPQQVIRFGVIGTVGFLIDGGILTLLNSAFDIELFRSRLISFGFAVTITWYLNRQHTFLDRKSRRVVHEWGRYVIANGVGALLNLVIFFILIYNIKALEVTPLIPLAIASVSAMIFNFIVSKNYAFRGG